MCVCVCVCVCVYVCACVHLIGWVAVQYHWILDESAVFEQVQRTSQIQAKLFQSRRTSLYIVQTIHNPK